jgi:hypothetical protein
MAQLLEDIAEKERSWFTRIDISKETNGGLIAVLKTESMINNFLYSKYMSDLRENPRYIDYYTLVKTHLTLIIHLLTLRNSFRIKN